MAYVLTWGYQIIHSGYLYTNLRLHSPVDQLWSRSDGRNFVMEKCYTEVRVEGPVGK